MPQRASRPRRLPAHIEAALRNKLTAVLLRIELAQALTTNPQQRAHIDAALQAALGAAALLER